MMELKDIGHFPQFKMEIRNHRRYIRTPDAERFLKSVRDTCKMREQTLNKGALLYRCQIGSEIKKDDEGKMV